MYRRNPDAWADVGGFENHVRHGPCSFLWNDRPGLRMVRDGSDGAVAVAASRLQAHFDLTSRTLSVENRSIGLQAFWWVRMRDGVALTDDPVSLARFRKLDYHWKVAAQHVLLANPVEFAAPFEGVETVGPGQALDIAPSSERARLLFDLGEHLGFGDRGPKIRRFDEAAAVVEKAFEACVSSVPAPFQLGLSGGVDSRLILALLHWHKVNFRTYTLAEPTHPDATTARQLAETLRRPWRLFDWTRLQEMAQHLGASPASLRDHICHFARFTINSTPLYAAIRRLPLSGFAGEGHTLIDGGFGEIFRSRYLLQARLASRFRNIDADFLLQRVASPVLSHPRNTEIRLHIRQALETAWQASTGRDIHERLDHFSIRTRLAHFGGPEQRRLDTLLPNVSPFADAEFIRTCLKIDCRVRQSPAFVRYCLERWCPEIADVPLVSHGRTVPPRTPALVTAILQRMRPARPPDAIPDMERLVLDTFADEFESLVRQNGGLGYYDESWLQDVVRTRSYAATANRRPFLEWLAFALAVSLPQGDGGLGVFGGRFPRGRGSRVPPSHGDAVG